MFDVKVLFEDEESSIPLELVPVLLIPVLFVKMLFEDEASQIP